MKLYELTSNCWGDIVSFKKGEQPAIYHMWFDQKTGGNSMKFVFDQKQMEHLADRIYKAIEKAEKMPKDTYEDFDDKTVQIFIDKYGHHGTYEINFEDALICPIFDHNHAMELVEAIDVLSKRYGKTRGSQIKAHKKIEKKKEIKA